MSTSITSATPLTLDVSQTPRVPFARLVSVELRKMVDTRAGRWLLISIAGVTALVLIIQLWVVVAQDVDVDFGDFAAGANIPMNILLPLLGAMAVSAEWSQRTGMVTFALEPSRTRIIEAKFAGTMVVAVAAVIVGIALSVLASLLYLALSGNDLSWFSLFDVFCILLLYVFAMATGFAFGALFLNTAAAIVLYFVYQFILPTLFAIGAELMDWFDNVRPWIDFANAQIPLQNGDVSGEEWAQLLTSGVLWLVLPLSIGIWRVLRAEVK